MSKKTLNETCKDLYEDSGQAAVFEHINSFSDSKFKKLKLAWERCNACETISPSQNHNCLVCGQETKTVKFFYEAHVFYSRKNGFSVAVESDVELEEEDIIALAVEQKKIDGEDARSVDSTDEIDEETYKMMNNL